LERLNILQASDAGATIEIPMGEGEPPPRDLMEDFCLGARLRKGQKVI